MKKSWLLIVTIIFSLINLLVAWFADVLWSNLWIFALLLQLLALATLGICAVVAIIRIIMQPKRIPYYLALLTSIVTVVLIFFFPFREVKTNVEFILFKNDRNKIIQMAENNELYTDNLSEAKLPLRYRYLSADGTVHIKKYEDGMLVYFYILRAVGGAIELLYSSGGEALIYESSDACYITEIKPMGDNWYYIVTD